MLDEVCKKLMDKIGELEYKIAFLEIQVSKMIMPPNSSDQTNKPPEPAKKV